MGSAGTGGAGLGEDGGGGQAFHFTLSLIFPLFSLHRLRLAVGGRGSHIMTGTLGGTGETGLFVYIAMI